MIANALHVLAASEPEPHNLTLRRYLTLRKTEDSFEQVEGTDTFVHYYEDWNGLCVYVDLKLDVAGIGVFDTGLGELTDRADVELKLNSGSAAALFAKIHELVLELRSWGTTMNKTERLMRSLVERYTTSTKALLHKHRLGKFPTIEVESGEIFLGIG
jgi:hypothetical protein